MNTLIQDAEQISRLATYAAKSLQTNDLQTALAGIDRIVARAKMLAEDIGQEIERRSLVDEIEHED